MNYRKSWLMFTFITLALLVWTVGPAMAADKPNILVIWGDDVGVHNISAYNHGIMGYKTPNIDRIAKEGAMFTDAYAQQSCTAGRSSFVLGQNPFRTGLLTIGMPLSFDHPRCRMCVPHVGDCDNGHRTNLYGRSKCCTCG